MKVEFLNLKAGYLELKDEIDAAVMRVVKSGWYVLGPEVETFEEAFANYCSARYAIGVANGLDALVLALRALGVGHGDEVIVPSNTYIATWLAVSAVGAIPVPVEPDPATHNIDAERIEDVITRATRAIIVVHLYGQPADLNRIASIARRYDLAIVEDAAQCAGARYHGERIGAFGDLVCWSFYPGKNLGAFGDGGAVTTNNTKLARYIRMCSNYGSSKKYVHEMQGINSRLDPIQAAILGVKLNHLDRWNARRNEIAKQYLVGLNGLSGITLPIVPSWAESVWHLFVIRCVQRQELQAYLADCGIDTLVHYPNPPHLQNAYRSETKQWPVLPIAESLATQVISLPMWPQMSDDSVNIVIDAVRSFNNSANF